MDKISEMIELVNTIVNEGKISLDKASETYLVEYPAEQTHEVFKVPDGWYCSCKSYLDNGICEHILAVNATPRVAEIVETRRPFRRPDYPRDRGDRRIRGEDLQVGAQVRDVIGHVDQTAEALLQALGADKAVAA